MQTERRKSAYSVGHLLWDQKRDRDNKRNDDNNNTEGGRSGTIYWRIFPF